MLHVISDISNHVDDTDSGLISLCTGKEMYFAPGLKKIMVASLIFYRPQP